MDAIPKTDQVFAAFKKAVTELYVFTYILGDVESPDDEIAVDFMSELQDCCELCDNCKVTVEDVCSECWAICKSLDDLPKVRDLLIVRYNGACEYSEEVFEREYMDETLGFLERLRDEDYISWQQYEHFCDVLYHIHNFVIDWNERFDELFTYLGESIDKGLFGYSPIEEYRENLEEAQLTGNGQQSNQAADAKISNQEIEQAVNDPRKENKKQTASEIPTIRNTDKERLVFGNALKKQYMTLENGRYKWSESKSLLAYMCGRLYCDDRIKEDESDYSMKYVKGYSQMPAKEVKNLFGIDVASNRYAINGPPRYSWKVDDLFKNNEASR